MQTRYTRPDFEQTPGLVGVPRVVRVTEELLPVDDHKTATWLVSKIAVGMLLLTALLYFFIYVGLDATRYWDNQRACEFQHFACDGRLKRAWQYECTDDGKISLQPSANPDLPQPFAFGETLMDEPCDHELTRASFWWFLPLPTLILSAVVLPLGLFRNNAHRTTLKKLLLWTPSVPLIIFQCFFRACILLSTIADADDKAYASIMAVEAIVLVPQVAVFLLMDSLRHPTPQLRLCYALALLLRFFVAVVTRATYEYPVEQYPLLPAGPVRDAFMGAGSASKQSSLASVDWTIMMMLISSILSVINYPSEMAVVRLRCDTKGYFNWRDQYLASMEVRAARRDLDYADHALWLRAKLPIWLGRQRESLREGIERMAASMGGMVARSQSRLVPRGSTTRRRAVPDGTDAQCQVQAAAARTTFEHSSAHLSDRV